MPRNHEPVRYMDRTREYYRAIGYENAGFVSAALGITSLILVGVLKPWTAPAAADIMTRPEPEMAVGG